MQPKLQPLRPFAKDMASFAPSRACTGEANRKLLCRLE